MAGQSDRNHRPGAFVEYVVAEHEHRALTSSFVPTNRIEVGPFLMKTESVRDRFRVQVQDYAGLMRRLIPFYDQQLDVMRALIPFERKASLWVLDLGCGPGLMAAEMIAEFPHASLTLFDLTSVTDIPRAGVAWFLRAG